MSLSILDGRRNFWQWDTGQRLLVGDTTCGEVHYCNGTGDCALVTKIETLESGLRVAAVPNVLLQSSDTIVAYLYQVDEHGARTRRDYRFRVLPRNRPDDYVYTETEVFNYAYIDRRMTALEEKVGRGEFASPGTNILFVDITKDENDKYYSSHSASEIKAHVENGGFVVGRYGAKTLFIEEITEEYVAFTYNKPGGSSSNIYRVFDDKTILWMTASHAHSGMISTSTAQSFSQAQKSQARENIGALAKDDVTETVMGMLIELGIAPVLLDNDGAVLVDSDGVILLNK